MGLVDIARVVALTAAAHGAAIYIWGAASSNSDDERREVGKAVAKLIIAVFWMGFLAGM
jgi:hypothetical protein